MLARVFLGSDRPRGCSIKGAFRNRNPTSVSTRVRAHVPGPRCGCVSIASSALCVGHRHELLCCGPRSMRPAFQTPVTVPIARLSQRAPSEQRPRARGVLPSAADDGNCSIAASFVVCFASIAAGRPSIYVSVGSRLRGTGQRQKCEARAMLLDAVASVG